MSTGLIALLDDIAGLAKVAAASLDDVAAQATKAGVKAAGVVIDDAAVTPRYLGGFAASRELPIVGRIALGSLRNKLLFLLPIALALSMIAPWAITPLLMLGGAYLCYEGTEKVFEALWPDPAHQHEVADRNEIADPRALEEEKVSAAIATDFILSAEIMAITLSTLEQSSFWSQVTILAGVGIALTILVYGAVALIVKADDLGLALARAETPVSGLFRRKSATGEAVPASRADRIVRPLSRGIGRGLVLGMPILLGALSVIGTAAMVWVGGGILIHGLEEFGAAWIAHTVHDAASAAGHSVPTAAALVEWGVAAAASGVFGLLVGAPLIPLWQHLCAPAMRRLGRLRGAKSADRSPPD